MANPNLIQIKQIDPSLSSYIVGVTSGSIAAVVASYIATGYQSPNVLAITGGNQTVLGPTTFFFPISIPYSGGSGQSVAMQYVNDQVAALQSLATGLGLNVVHLTGNESIQGVKTLNSVIIAQGITGNALSFISGNFSNGLTVPNINLGTSDPTSPINLNFFYNQNIAFTSGDQTIGGNKTFSNSPVLNAQATGNTQAVRFDQFSTSGNFLQQQIGSLFVGSSTTGFGGVLSFNGQSGYLFALGRGGITVKQQGPLTFISGSQPVVTGSGVYLIQGDQGPPGLFLNPRGTWNTGITYGYLDMVSFSGNAYASLTGHLSSAYNMPGTGGSINISPWGFLLSGGGIPGPIGPIGTGLPGATGATGAWQPQGLFNFGTTYVTNNAVSYVGSTYGFSGVSSVGFAPTTGANWYLIAQSGTPGGQGLQGPGGVLFTWRNIWASTGNYQSGDAVYYNGSSFGTSFPASGTTPGTGIPWFTISSGATGPTGAWQPQGNFNFGTTYYLNNAIQYGGSTYGFSGTSSVGLAPTTGANWYLIAGSGSIGQQGIQGIQGLIGLTGAWQYSGNWNNTTTYYYNNAVQYGGATYGFSGSPSSIGAPPMTGSGWYLIAGSGLVGQQGIQGIQGLIGSFVNSGTITGNFTNLSFYFDYPFTGLYLAEAFIAQKFTFTGYALGCVNTGLGPAHLNSGYSGVPIWNQMSGSIYQRDLNNNVTQIVGVSFNSGMFSKVSGNFFINVPSLARVGFSLYSGLSGLKGLTLMVAGF